MTQRMAINLLAALCLILAVYLVASIHLLGVEGDRVWEEATRTYVEEYHRWLSESPRSGWARVEALAAGPERERIERLRSEAQAPSEWRYGGGEYRLMLQAAGKSMVEATYHLQTVTVSEEVQEIYLLEKGLQGIKVTRVMGGSPQ